VPFASVGLDLCPLQTPSYAVTVRNQSPTPGVLPYDTPTCVNPIDFALPPGDPNAAAFTLLPPGTVTDYIQKEDLGALGLPTLPVGAVFQFDVIVSNPVGLPAQTVVTSLMNAEANPATDYISIPNPATPTLRPAGFNFTDAKLGQNLTVSWTLPAFEIGSIQVVTNTHLDTTQMSGQGRPPAFTLPEPTCAPPPIDLPTDAIAATFKLPRTCAGIPVNQAQFCIVIVGTSDANNKTTTACWFFDFAP